MLLIYLRFRTLHAAGVPPTIDGGNWLAYGDQIFGNGVRSPTIVYPPLVPLASKAAVGLLGLAAGISLLGALAAALPAMGVYLTMRWSNSGAAALPAALLVLGASSIGEPAAWGGFPQLIALGIMPVTLLSFERLMRTWSRRDALTTGLALAGVLMTSHFVGALTTLAILIVGVMMLIDGSMLRPPLRTGFAAASLVVLPIAWLTPLYVALFDAFGNPARTAPFFNELTWGTLVDQIEFLYRDFRWPWRLLLGGALLAGPIIAWKQRSPLGRITVGLFGAILAATVLTRESRFLYALTPWAALATALWAGEIKSRTQRVGTSPPRQRHWRIASHVSFAVLLILGGWQVAAGQEFFETQRATYAVLTEDLVEGLEFIDDSASPEAVLAVTSLNDAPLGWWVEAIAHRETLYGAPLRWLLFEDEIRRATIANDIFVPPFPTPDRIDRASKAGIDLILVPTRWVFFDEDAIAVLADESPGSVSYVSDELVVITP